MITWNRHWEEEKRKEFRHLTVVDVTLHYQGRSYPAEVLDVSPGGLGLTSLAVDERIPKNSMVRVEGLVPLPRGVECTTTQDVPAACDCRPNDRTVGLSPSETQKKLLGEILSSIADSEEPGMPCSRGFLRAWNSLHPHAPEKLRAQKTLLNFLDALRHDGAQGRILAHNLLRDPNTQAAQVKILLNTLVPIVVANEIRSPVDTLRRARSACADQLLMISKNRAIHLHPRARLSRFVRSSTLKRWLADSPEALNPDDLIRDFLEGIEGSRELIVEAILASKSDPTLGHPESSIVWTIPTEELAYMREQGFDDASILKAISPDLLGTHEGPTIEVSYSSSVSADHFKPCSIAAANHTYFRFTPETDTCGRTIGNELCPSLPEIIHPQTTISIVVRSGAQISAWNTK